MDLIPQWLINLLSILSVPSILLTIVVWLLGRRDANRRLDVEEGTLKKSEFDSFNAAQTETIKRADARATAAETAAQEANDHANDLDEAFQQLRESFWGLKGWIRKTLAAHNVEMTEQERAEFEATKPPPRPTRVK